MHHIPKPKWEINLSSECPCGSGLKYRKCCRPNAALAEKSQEFFDKKDFPSAERAARAELTRYIGWVYKHTLPTLGHPKGPFLPIIEIDIDAFGMDITGLVANDNAPANVIDPAASPLTSGPYGVVSNYVTFNPGWFDGLGTNATAIARLAANNQPTLALIPPRKLSATSGPVVMSTSAKLPTNLVNNALALGGQTNRLFEFTGTLLLQNNSPGTSQVQIVAVDADNLSMTQWVTVIVSANPSPQGLVAAPGQNASSPVIRSGAIEEAVLSKSNGASLPRLVLQLDLQPPASVFRLPSGNASQEVVLVWSASPGQRFMVETSGDLVHWNGPVAASEEIASGSYRSALGLLEESPHFFRIRPISDP